MIDLQNVRWTRVTCGDERRRRRGRGQRGLLGITEYRYMAMAVPYKTDECAKCQKARTGRATQLRNESSMSTRDPRRIPNTNMRPMPVVL